MVEHWPSILVALNLIPSTAPPPQKKEMTETCNKMGESPKHYAKCKKPESTSYVLLDSLGKSKTIENTSVVAKGW